MDHEEIHRELTRRITERLGEHIRGDRHNLIYLGILANEPPLDKAGPLGFERQAREHDAWETQCADAGCEADDGPAIQDLWNLTEGLLGTRVRIREDIKAAMTEHANFDAEYERLRHDRRTNR